MRKIKILFCSSVMHRGGMEMMMMNYARNINHSRFQIDFLEQGHGYGVFDDEIKALGGNVFYFRKPKTKLVEYNNYLKHILQANDYQIIHCHMEASSFFPLYVAKKAKIPIRIAHAHSTDYYEASTPTKRFVYSICKKLLRYVGTNFCACSKTSAIWMFGKEIANSEKCQIINNAINLNDFAFNISFRKEIRNQFGIPNNALVIGNVARFMQKEKNQLFLLDIFRLFNASNDNSFLMLVGGGQDKELIQKKIDIEKIKNVILVENTSKIFKFYSAFDVFCMPSFFEGFSFSALEALTNGLPCLLSTGIPNNPMFNSTCEYLPLNAGASTWNQVIKSLINAGRKDNSKEVIKNGFSIKEEAKKLENYYISLLKLYNKK